jgi:hypothetical protein
MTRGDVQLMKAWILLQEGDDDQAMDCFYEAQANYKRAGVPHNSDKLK